MESQRYERRHANWWSKPDAVRVNNCVGDHWQQFVEGTTEEDFHAVGPDYVIPEPADDAS